MHTYMIIIPETKVNAIGNINNYYHYHLVKLLYLLKYNPHSFV